MEYFLHPNIPNKCSKGVLVDFRTSEESISTLKSLGIEVFKTQRIKCLYSSVCGHADMQIHHLGDNRFVTAPEVYEYYNELFAEACIINGSKKLSNRYPEDIYYNAAAFGNFLLCNSSCTATEILSEYRSMNKTILNVKQGYAKCSICIINENAVITSDKGIYKKLYDNGIDVLLISSGFINLQGVSYGFIGGATGLISNDLLAVNGDISTHPNSSEIISFCKNYNVNIISLKKGTLDDIGSIIPIF